MPGSGREGGRGQNGESEYLAKEFPLPVSGPHQEEEALPAPGTWLAPSGFPPPAVRQGSHSLSWWSMWSWRQLSGLTCCPPWGWKPTQPVCWVPPHPCFPASWLPYVLPPPLFPFPPFFLLLLLCHLPPCPRSLLFSFIPPSLSPLSPLTLHHRPSFVGYRTGLWDPSSFCLPAPDRLGFSAAEGSALIPKGLCPVPGHLLSRPQAWAVITAEKPLQPQPGLPRAALSLVVPSVQIVGEQTVWSTRKSSGPAFGFICTTISLYDLGQPSCSPWASTAASIKWQQ